MSQADILREAEQMVRAALRDDLKQKVSEATIRAVAQKVAKAVPQAA